MTNEQFTRAVHAYTDTVYRVALNCLKSYLSFGSEEESSDLTKAVEFFSALDKYKFSSGMEQYAHVLQKLNELSMLNMDAENAMELENKLKEEKKIFSFFICFSLQKKRKGAMFYYITFRKGRK